MLKTYIEQLLSYLLNHAIKFLQLQLAVYCSNEIQKINIDLKT